MERCWTKSATSLSSITLAQLLQSRDERFARQVSLSERFPGRTLVCMTVVLPGPVKRDARSLKVADAGVAAIREALAPAYQELSDLETGYEGYFLVDGPLLQVKRTCCRIEDEHPYGRLLDLDVLEPVGDGVAPVGRERVGLEPRRCLLCDRPARECMRARVHPYEELLHRIDEILDSAGDNLGNR